jgi:hypothetical protein
MNKEVSKFSNEQSLTLEERLDRLWQVVQLENTQSTTIWLQARLTEIANAIQEEVTYTSAGVQLSGIPEWEKLVGGNEEVDFDVTARKYVQELLDVKLTEIEQQLKIE